jgi:hypothetical protein
VTEGFAATALKHWMMDLTMHFPGEIGEYVDWHRVEALALWAATPPTRQRRKLHNLSPQAKAAMEAQKKPRPPSRRQEGSRGVRRQSHRDHARPACEENPAAARSVTSRRDMTTMTRKKSETTKTIGGASMSASDWAYGSKSGTGSKSSSKSSSSGYYGRAVPRATSR